MARDITYNKLIHTGKWREIRRSVLTEHPLCQRCLADGRITAASEVHHIRPVEEAFTAAEKEQRMYDPGNLLSLCHACHVKVHTELGKGSKEIVRKRNDEQVRRVIDKFFGDG